MAGVTAVGHSVASQLCHIESGARSDCMRQSTTYQELVVPSEHQIPDQAMETSLTLLQLPDALLCKIASLCGAKGSTGIHALERTCRRMSKLLSEPTGAWNTVRGCAHIGGGTTRWDMAVVPWLRRNDRNWGVRQVKHVTIASGTLGVILHLLPRLQVLDCVLDVPCATGLRDDINVLGLLSRSPSLTSVKVKVVVAGGTDPQGMEPDFFNDTRRQRPGWQWNIPFKGTGLPRLTHLDLSVQAPVHVDIKFSQVAVNCPHLKDLTLDCFEADASISALRALTGLTRLAINLVCDWSSKFVRTAAIQHIEQLTNLRSLALSFAPAPRPFSVAQLACLTSLLLTATLSLASLSVAGLENLDSLVHLDLDCPTLRRFEPMLAHAWRSQLTHLRLVTHSGGLAEQLDILELQTPVADQWRHVYPGPVHAAAEVDNAPGQQGQSRPRKPSGASDCAVIDCVLGMRPHMISLQSLTIEANSRPFPCTPFSLSTLHSLTSLDFHGRNHPVFFHCFSQAPLLHLQHLCRVVLGVDGPALPVLCTRTVQRAIQQLQQSMPHVQLEVHGKMPAMTEPALMF